MPHIKIRNIFIIIYYSPKKSLFQHDKKINQRRLVARTIIPLSTSQENMRAFLALRAKNRAIRFKSSPCGLRAFRFYPLRPTGAQRFCFAKSRPVSRPHGPVVRRDHRSLPHPAGFRNFEIASIKIPIKIAG
jgi:hypothetical protein